MNKLLPVVFYSLRFCYCTLCFFLLLASISLSGQHVRVGVYQNHPKVFTDDKGQPQGIFIDILNHIAEEEGWELEYIDSDWHSHVEDLRDHRIDLLPDAARTGRRDSVLSYNRIFVLQSWMQVYINGANEKFTVEDLRDKKIGVLSGSSQEEFMQLFFSKSMVLSVFPKPFQIMNLK
jgi:ABC-type amino acid transport substrate-binding protein